MNLPNLLTSLRFIIVPFFGYFLYREQYFSAVTLFIIGGITDVLDGYIARKLNMITSFGKLADPIADKFMQITALLFLTTQELIPIPVLIIVIAKEIFMGVGSILLYRKEKFIVSANWYGKMATVIFYFAIILTIVLKMESLKNYYTDVLINILIGVAVVSTLFAFFMYSLTFRKIRSESNV